MTYGLVCKVLDVYVYVYNLLSQCQCLELIS